ncbi:Ser-Thr-rich glycosyl-phosphatidyl-inositol-anchored membrane family-domain-containing protein [Parachaetomium inaequale]|uniref:Ser-Thr-rich glycosyl-phosphatidyl-inositol-anchored membrane family-domain-containing protein n=1 Tax=Parachaetomium inaequale TaxID=2588326 RepID=A0AAN6PEF0_9PEZI|nr:Ser-Thr-rich glycosyl-phosphatidyl-inositol-anchored membrane family-domain-containing protein [Parachaetomium inaequale]
MRSQFATLLALAAPLYAIKITSPSKNDVVDPSKGVTVKWSTVNTDPTRAHLILVNMASGHTPFSKDLGEIDLSSGSFQVSEKDVPSDAGYQFNFESTATQNTGILAQSEQFEVKASSDDDDEKTSTSASSATTSATLMTTVKTVTNTYTSTGSDTTVTGTATTLATSTGTFGESTGANTKSAASSTSTGAAAPTGMAVQGGSLLALVAGVAAVLA